AIWRVSRSVFVRISPFTFTRICSMISARTAVASEAAKRDDTATAAAAWNRGDLGMVKLLETSILPLIEQIAQQPADLLENTARGARIVFGWLQNLEIGRAACRER